MKYTPRRLKILWRILDKDPPRYLFLTEKRLQDSFATPELGLLRIARAYSGSKWGPWIWKYIYRRRLYNSLSLLVFDAVILTGVWL